MNRMATKRCNFADLTESIGSPVIDKEAGIIRNVRILGRVSGNGREYSDRAMQQAATLYEGKGVNVNHPDRANPGVGRSVQDGIGQLRGVNVKPDGVYGDLHYLKSHPVAGILCESAERMPDRFGLSHNAVGDSVERGGKRIVESIENVRSVDLVQNPATNKSLFESQEQSPMTTKTLTEVIESLPKDHKARKGLTTLMEMDALPMITGDMPVDMEMGEAGTAAPTADQAAKAAFVAAIKAIIEDDSIDWPATQTKVAELLATMAKMDGGGEAEGETETEGDETVTEQLREELDQLKAELAAEKTDKANRALLESKGIAVTDHRLKTLKAVTDKATQTSLMEDWAKITPVKGGAPRPAKSPPANLVEGLDANYKAPKGKAAMLSSYK
jgi:hypothetical protein